MKNRFRLLIGLGVCLLQLGLSSLCVAQTPEESFQGLVKVVKSSKSIEKALGSVDWKGILSKMSREERAALKITDEASLKAYYTAKVTNSGKERVEKVSGDLKAELKRSGSSEAEAARLSGETSELLKQADKSNKTEDDRFYAEVSYKISSAEVEGTVANVSVQRVFRERVEEWVVPMVQSDGKWLLTSAAVFNRSAAPGCTTPVGPIAQPETVLSQW